MRFSKSILFAIFTKLHTSFFRSEKYNYHLSWKCNVWFSLTVVKLWWHSPSWDLLKCHNMLFLLCLANSMTIRHTITELSPFKVTKIGFRLKMKNNIIIFKNEGACHAYHMTADCVHVGGFLSGLTTLLTKKTIPASYGHMYGIASK